LLYNFTYLINGHTTGYFNRFEYDSTTRSDIHGFNALIGLMYVQKNKFRLGLSVRIPTVYTISQNTTESYDSYFDYDHFSIVSTSSQEYELTTPLVLSMGFSVQPVDWIMLAGDAEYTDWTQLEMKSDDPVLDATLQSENRSIKSLLRATTKLRGGAELNIIDWGLKLRGGISWNPSPYAANQSTTDYDQFYYTAGLSVRLDENTSLDFAYALGYAKYVKSTYPIFDQFANYASAVQTNENLNSSVVNITMTYRF
jgi:long-subunit fatty acid transport protein